MSKICVTGGCGFIGSHLVENLVKNGNQVVVIDNLSTGKLDNIKHLSDVKLIEADIRDREKVIKAVKGCSGIFHLAAEISVPKSIENPHLTEEVNVTGTINMLEAAREHSVDFFVFASSAAVYGDSQECPKKLDMYPNPISPYAISKLAGEYYVNMYSKLYGFRGISTRFFNVFGERQDPSSGYAAAVPAFMTRALAGKNLVIYGDGEQTRDFIYVRDLVSYLIELSVNGNGLYNIGYGQYITINELAKTIIEMSGKNIAIEYAAPRPGDVRFSYADTGSIKDIEIDLIGLRKGLRNTMDWYEDNCENNSI